MLVYFVLATTLLTLFLMDRGGLVQTGKSAKGKNKQKKQLQGVHSFYEVVSRWMPCWGKPNYIALEVGAETYGKVYAVEVGSSYTVAVMDINLAKELMSSADWSNRLPDNHVLYERSFNKPLGVLFGNDENWTHSREFAVKTLHQLGFGKGNSMESCVLLEVEETLRKFDEIIVRDGGLLSPHGAFHLPTLNILWQLMAGSRFKDDDQELKVLMKYFYEWNRSFNLGATPLYAFPWLRYIPGATEQDAWVTGHEKFHVFFRRIIENRKKKGAFMENPSDFIDHFLKEMQSRTGDSSKFYTDETLLTLCVDLFMAGADTTSNSLEFALLFMVLNPHVQRKVQEEIDSVVGTGLPSLLYKSRMTYTEATTLEVLRHGCVIPVSGRCPKNDMQINDCFIPKGSLMAINIHGIHFSEQIWEDPHAFRPERFLDPTGRIINTEKVLPFGHGKRKCVGESSSRNTFFLFFTSMLQKYVFELAPNHPPPTTEEICGLSRAPKPFHTLVKPRKL